MSNRFLKLWGFFFVIMLFFTTIFTVVIYSVASSYGESYAALLYCGIIAFLTGWTARVITKDE